MTQSSASVRRVLVTGASGYLGGWVLSRLIERIAGLEVTALLHHQEGDAPPGVEWKSFEQVIASGSHDVVIHMATKYGKTSESTASLIRANLLLPISLVDAGVCDGCLFINAGTALPKTLSAYSLSKHQCLEWLRHSAQERRMSVVNMVLQHFYGPGDSLNKFPTWLLHEFLRGAPSIELTHGRHRRDFVYVADVADAFVEVVLGRQCFATGRVIDVPVGSGRAITIREFTERLRSIAGGTSELRFGARQTRPHEPEVVVASSGWLQERGWVAKVGLDQGLGRMVSGEGTR